MNGISPLQAVSAASKHKSPISLVYGTMGDDAQVTNDDGDDAQANNVDNSSKVSQDQHLGKHRQYWRDIILGVNDGLVSTFLLVAGVAGGGLASIDILLTAISGALAGAVSMCAGEFVATKSQNEVLRGEIALERRHIAANPRDEMDEVSSLLTVIGISDDQDELREQMLTFYEQHHEALLQLMIALEFGVIEEEQRSPMWAGITSCLCFIVGSLPSVIPFAFNVSPTVGLVYAAAITVTSLLIVGAIKTWATRGNCLSAAIENLVIAGLGGGIAYGVGILFNVIVN